MKKINLSEKIIKSEKFKLLNFICTSRSDYHDLDEKIWHKAKVLNFIYLLFIFITVVVSFLPLFYISNPIDEKFFFGQWWMILINAIILVILFIDYIFRWITYPIRVEYISTNPLLFFFFTATSWMLLLSLASAFLFFSVSLYPENETLIKTAKLFAVFKIFRFILLLNIIPSFKILTEIFVKNRTIIITLLFAVISIVLILALVLYSFEYDLNSKINNYFDALYYSFISVTTVGFGDITCVTNEGRVISIILGIIGSIAFAIPFGAVIATFTSKIQERYKNKYENERIYHTSFIEKIFMKYKNKKRHDLHQYQIKIILKNFDKEKNVMLFNKFILFFGGQENIDSIIDYDNDIEIIIFDAKKINSEFKFLASIMKIEYKMENV